MTTITDTYEAYEAVVAARETLLEGNGNDAACAALHFAQQYLGPLSVRSLDYAPMAAAVRRDMAALNWDDIQISMGLSAIHRALSA